MLGLIAKRAPDGETFLPGRLFTRDQNGKAYYVRQIPDIELEEISEDDLCEEFAKIIYQQLMEEQAAEKAACNK